MIAKSFLIAFIWVVALLPMELIFVVRYLLAPEGFWQNLVVFGLGVYLLGAVQAIFAIIGLAATIQVIGEHRL